MSLRKFHGAEYSALRTEVDSNSQIVMTVFLANVTVTAGLIGYGLSSGYGLIFLSPFVIIIPSLFFITSQLTSTVRIAAYIKVFLEDEHDELNWEGRWLELRRKGLIPNKRKYTLAVSHLYGGLSVICIMLTYLYWDVNWLLFGIVVLPIVILVMFGVHFLVYAFSIEFSEKYVDAWGKLKRDRN